MQRELLRKKEKNIIKTTSLTEQGDKDGAQYRSVCFERDHEGL